MILGLILEKNACKEIIADFCLELHKLEHDFRLYLFTNFNENHIYSFIAG